MESKKMKSESVVPGEQKKTEFALGIAFAGFVFMVYAIMRNSK